MANAPDPGGPDPEGDHISAFPVNPGSRLGEMVPSWGSCDRLGRLRSRKTYDDDELGKLRQCERSERQKDAMDRARLLLAGKEKPSWVSAALHGT